jgi:hypothetical protein
LTVKWRQADSFVHVHYSIFSENTVNNALDSYRSINASTLTWVHDYVLYKT